MIGYILKLLSFVEVRDSELINQAKGKYKLPENINEFKRQLKWRLRKK
jgi:hypothetical protein